MLRQCAIILGCLALAELFIYVTGIRFPSSLVGMLLLTVLLKLGWVKLDWVKGISDWLLKHLGLFFVPPGVALMLHFGLIEAEWLPITAATLVSALVVLVLTGWTYQLLRRRS
ncbi:MAG: CidA/LrgA family protein [Burkholderiaceae bacterium]|nr:CidA/LrgA family protein [Burkholderiaceae bacterium]